MTEQKIYPADTVDSAGKVWDTVGENIRNGKKSSVKNVVDNAIDDLLNAMYPVGYTYIGELPPLLKKKFKWEIGLPGVTGRSGAYISFSRPVGSKPIFITNATVLTTYSSGELQSFNKATGLSIPDGSIAIPICHRVE